VLRWITNPVSFDELSAHVNDTPVDDDVPDSPVGATGAVGAAAVVAEAVPYADDPTPLTAARRYEYVVDPARPVSE
jgi:hypothetical protein